MLARYEAYIKSLSMDRVSIVDMIFDDFESRTCENCKFYIPFKDLELELTGADGRCENIDVISMDRDLKSSGYFETRDDFGCNQFGWKENEPTKS